MHVIGQTRDIPDISRTLRYALKTIRNLVGPVIPVYWRLGIGVLSALLTKRFHIKTEYIRIMAQESHKRLDRCVIVCVIHTMRSVELIRELEKAGWVLKRVRGSHHVFTHPQRRDRVVVPHPKHELGVGLVAKIRKQAGLR